MTCPLKHSSRVRPSVEALQAYTPGEQLPLPDLIKLNTNENPYPPSPAVARALREFPAETLHLYPDPQCSALRARLAQIHHCDIDQIFVGNGSDEVLRLVTRAFTRPGGSAATFTPSYSLYPVLTAIEEIRMDFVELPPETFAWCEPPSSLSATLFFLANPNAPTGVLYPAAAVEAFCRRFPGVVLIDEAYIDFSGTPGAAAFAATSENTLVSRTLSKSFSLAGLRLGYLIGPRPLIAAIQKIKDSYNVDALAQALALAALNDLDYMHANAARLCATRAHTQAELIRRGWTVIPSATNFLFARPPATAPTAAEIFADLRRRHILVRYFPAPRTADYLRISMGTDLQMKALLEALP